MIHLLNMLFLTSQAVQFPESYWNLSSYRWFSTKTSILSGCSYIFPHFQPWFLGDVPRCFPQGAERLDPLERVLNFHHSIGSHWDGRTSGDISKMTSGQGLTNLQQISLLSAIYICMYIYIMLYAYTYIYIYIKLMCKHTHMYAYK